MDFDPFPGLMAPYVQKLITDMAEEEVSMLLGVSGEITKLEDNMEGSRIKELNQRLDEIRRGAAEFNFLANIRSSRNRRTIADAEHSSSLKSMSEFDETAIVGEKIERDTKELAQVLLNDENHHDLKVVSIVGMGGMGKTTLAQKIFNEPTVQKHFKVKVWLSITQQFDEAELLRTAIEHAGGVLGGAQDKTLPTRNLTDALSAGRFLLVLDDMWSVKAWSDVFCVPARKASQKQLGSRILITTRLEHLAPMMGEYFHQHHVRPLDIEDAWSLLKKQLPPDQVLFIRSAGCDTLVGSLSTLKHLRYLHLEDTDVSRLLDDIHNMKFLQYIHLLDCEKLHHLPCSIVKFVHLRSLDISGSNVSAMPKGFGGLTNLRSLFGFPVYVDDVDHEGSSSWCSLQELAHLSQLRQLTLHGLQKVPASWMAGNAMLSSKAHLSYLELNYSSASGHTACHGGEADEQEQQRQPSVIQEEVLEKLCPPTYYLEHLVLEGGYAGRQLPYWMHAPASAADFKSLRFLQLESLPCCTQLPDAGHTAAALAPPFPKLINLKLVGLCDWEEWEWNGGGCEQQQGSAKASIAMPCLKRLEIQNCKLRYLPPGLASVNRQALRRLHLYDLTNLTSVENFPSVVKLDVFRSPKLERISGLSSLHEIRIVSCPNLEVLEGVPSSLDSLALQDHAMEALPGYLRAVNPRYLRLHCSKKLYKSLSSPGSSDWNKIHHIGKHDISYNEN
ncbi:unnamed protein product [Urochloa decumbens]|uniref:NB-ARC domain-containing protein n=1 Tax=Urochloa decumbens TaxID=240449 RepID=A0ABC9B478_9POAL